MGSGEETQILAMKGVGHFRGLVHQGLQLTSNTSIKAGWSVSGRYYRANVISHGQDIIYNQLEGGGAHRSCPALGLGGRSRSIFSVTSADHSNIYKKVRNAESLLNMDDLIAFGRDADRTTLLASAQWLQKDLPVRMGHRVQVFARLFAISIL